MGTIHERTGRDGKVSYRAQVRKKKGQETLFSEAKTFNRRRDAEGWMKRMEQALSSADPASFAARHATVASAIERYLAKPHRNVGKTKVQCLQAISEMSFGQLKASEAGQTEIIELMATLIQTRKPQTVANYIAHLSSIYSIAKPAYRIDLRAEEMQQAKITGRAMGYLCKSRHRARRPTRTEMDRIMAHFSESTVRTDSMPMHKVVAFSMSSSRRQDEICRLRWDDLDVEASRVLVRNMKHPGEKVGNDVHVDLPPESLAIILSMPRVDSRIFPFVSGSVCSAFTRAMKVHGIVDLHFHDLRHEAATRLFEMGWNVPQVQLVTGHRTWPSLERYTHVKKRGDVWADWTGWELASQPETADRIEELRKRLVLKVVRPRRKVIAKWNAV